MNVKKKVVRYDLSITDKDITILIECIRKSKLENCRHTLHAESLLDSFVGMFLDENKEKYINRYLELVGRYWEYEHNIELDRIEMMLNFTRDRINDDHNYVFHYDSKDWAIRLVNGFECSDDKDYEAEIIADVMKKPSDKAIQRNKNAQELLRKLRGN